MRTIAIAAGGLPEDSAKMVSCDMSLQTRAQLSRNLANAGAISNASLSARSRACL
jgi:hypothetical protein